MALDPQAKVYLEKLSSLNLPEFHTMPPAEARKLFRAMRGLGPKPDPVDAVENRIVAGSIPVRAYRPLNAGLGPLPALVYYHGGGWVLGDLETVDNLCRRLANASGCSVISVDYRLSPEHKFPVPLEDCFEALKAVIQDAGSFGVDRHRVAVGGDSAGANLAVGVALKFQGSVTLAFMLLAYPITDFSFETKSYRENAESYGLSREMMIWYWDQYLARPEDGDSPLASPFKAEELSGLPPTLMITAGFDVLRDEGVAFAHRLKQADVPVEEKHYPGMIHGFLQMADSFDQAKQAIQDAGNALRRAMIR